MNNLPKQVSVEHYEFSKYITKPRWMSFYYQVDEILQRHPETVLEVGSGSGILRAILNSFGIKYSSLDIDPDLKPDFVASVLKMPFTDQSFDMVVCFQMLEHIPFRDFVPALEEIRRVSRKHAIISLPDAQPKLILGAYIPKLGPFNLAIPIPGLNNRRHKFDGEHHWEINKKGFSLNKIESDIFKAGFKIDASFRPLECHYQRFYCLSK